MQVRRCSITTRALGKHGGGGTDLVTGVSETHWQVTDGLGPLSTLARGRFVPFLLKANQLTLVWTSQGTIQPCLHSPARDVNIISSISTVISPLKYEFSHRLLTNIHRVTRTLKSVKPWLL